MHCDYEIIVGHLSCFSGSRNARYEMLGKYEAAQYDIFKYIK